MPVTLVGELNAALFALFFGFGVAFAVHGLFVLRILLGADTGGAIPARLAAFRFPCIPQKTNVKKSHPARDALLFLLDFVFSLSVGLAFLLFLYARHDGVFRLFLLVFAVLGAILYFFTLGRLVFRFLGVAAYLLRVLLLYLALILFLPVRLLLCAILFFARMLLFYLLSGLSCLCAPLVTRMALHRAKRAGSVYLLHCIKND